jgi:NAD(P)-dependent dehydrogenase (short-subunit alcohol dehydrogenase family)
MLLEDKVAVIYGVIDEAGRVDVSFNAVGIPDTDIVGVPLAGLEVDRFSLPIASYTRSYFLTARLAARRMAARKSGVIMTVTALLSRTECPWWEATGRRWPPKRRSLEISPPSCASGHSRGRPETAGHAGNWVAQGSLGGTTAALVEELRCVVDGNISVWKDRAVKSCGPSGSQDLAFLAAH